MIDKIIIKQLGQTVKQDGEVLLVSQSIPSDCLVLFVSKDVWAEIKKDVVFEETMMPEGGKGELKVKEADNGRKTYTNGNRRQARP